MKTEPEPDVDCILDGIFEVFDRWLSQGKFEPVDGILDCWDQEACSSHVNIGLLSVTLGVEDK